MKTSFVAAIFTTLVAFAAANPISPAANAAIEEARAILDTRASCSGSRSEDDICGGKFLNKRNSFHNCKTKDSGKCCATNSDGSGGIDVKNGIGSEDCGYCFSGKCGK